MLGIFIQENPPESISEMSRRRESQEPHVIYMVILAWVGISHDPSLFPLTNPI